jgi:hypothetical protein
MPGARRLLTCALAPLVVLLAAAAPAQADPTLTFAGACFAPGQPIGMQLAGFNPGEHVRITYHKEGPTDAPPTQWEWEIAAGSVLADGTVVVNPQNAPGHPRGPLAEAPGTIPFAAYAQDSNGNPSGPIAFANLTVANMHESHIRPQGGERPNRAMTYALTGFLFGPTIYLHYAYEGRLVKTIALGAPQAPCGTLKAKVRRWPIRRPKAGLWFLVFDQHKGFANDPKHQIITRVQVRARARR